MNKYGFIYLTTDNLNHKKYIGQRKYHHDNPSKDDRYFGSGNTIRYLLSVHGSGIFTREILEECDSLEELNRAEKKWISYYDAVNSPEFYNIHEGGEAGDTWSGQPEEYKERFKAIIRESNKRRKRDVSKIKGEKNPAFGRHWYKDIVNSKQYYLYEDDPLIKNLNLVKGMFRSKEHNKKISESNKGKAKQYTVYGKGCRWIHKSGDKTRSTAIFVKSEECEKYLAQGYIFGIKDK